MTQLKKKLVSTYTNTCVTCEKNNNRKLKDEPDEATLKKKEPKIGRPRNFLTICITSA